MSGLLAGLVGLVPGARAAIGAEAVQALQQSCPRWDDCGRAAESKAFDSAGPRARRSGTTLWLNLPGGPLRYDDDPAAGHRHRYLGELDGTGLDLIAGLRAGQPHYWLIDGLSGRVLEAEGLPWPSPDGRLILVAEGPRGGHGGSLTLYLRSGTRWTRPVYLEAAQGLSFAFRSWRMDSAAVRLAWTLGTGGTGSTCQGLTQLRDGPYGWDLVPEPPAACP